MTIAELKDIADELQIKYTSSIRKNQLIEVILSEN
ncbi:Rho termination factor N-terminal domain-containing protein [Clostridium baratii]